jgi:hypothetical protein
MILAITACSTPNAHAPNADTVNLLRTVLRYAADTLHIGPKVILARTTTSTPSIRLSLATQNALVSSDSSLVGIERYDVARQACDTVADVPGFCHFADADGLIAILEVRMWRDSADVGFEFFQTTEIASLGAVDSAINAKAKGKRIIVYNAGNTLLDRDASGRWRVKKFTESEFGDGVRSSARP